jgi:hypothetical protein
VDIHAAAEEICDISIFIAADDISCPVVFGEIGADDAEPAVVCTAAFSAAAQRSGRDYRSCRNRKNFTDEIHLLAPDIEFDNHFQIILYFI